MSGDLVADYIEYVESRYVEYEVSPPTNGWDIVGRFEPCEKCGLHVVPMRKQGATGAPIFFELPPIREVEVAKRRRHRLHDAERCQSLRVEGGLW